MKKPKKIVDRGELYFFIIIAVISDALLAVIWFSSETIDNKATILIVMAIPIMMGGGAHIGIALWWLWGPPGSSDNKPVRVPRYRSNGW